MGDFLNGKVTNITGLMLMGLGGYLIIKGQWERGFELVTAGLGVLGLRRAIGQGMTQTIQAVETPKQIVLTHPDGEVLMTGTSSTPLPTTAPASGPVGPLEAGAVLTTTVTHVTVPATGKPPETPLPGGNG